MFEQMSFDQAFDQSPDGDGSHPYTRPLRRRKTLGQKMMFWGTNALFLPFVALGYLVVSAEGLRLTLPLLAMRIYKMPVPGAEMLRQYQGWNRIDLSMLMALLLFVAVSYIWFRIFSSLIISGSVTAGRSQNPILFFLLAGIATVILLGDAAIFYFGLESKTASSWSNTPGYIPAVATIVYMAGLSLIGWFHADHHHSGIV